MKRIWTHDKRAGLIREKGNPHYICRGFKKEDGDLIAAAPEMLDVCKAACEYYEMLEKATGVEHGVLKELRTIIAKAEGGEADVESNAG